MVAIAKYFAQVGIDIDRRSLTQVDDYLKRIERQVQNFQRRASRSRSSYLDLKIDRNQLSQNLQNALNRVSRTVHVDLRRFNISTHQLSRAINNSLRNMRDIRLGAVLSQASLSGMRQQIRDSLSNMTISPRINPRVSNPRGGYGSSQNSAQSHYTTRNPTRGGFSPWHNPMMVGGGVGAFMRYGLYSLPFVGGAMGLNALSNNAQELQGQRMALKMTAGQSMGPDGLMRDDAYYAAYLDNLGAALGKKTSTMMPFFTQMLAGSKGTKLEPHLEEGFASLMQYSSIMGLGAENTKGAIKAFTQMISKQQIMAEELRGQAAEHLPPVVRMMADAVTGGDTKKLNKMMEMGQLDPNIHLPLLFAAMERESAPLLAEYQQGLRFKTGSTARASEEFLKQFLAGGAESGITSAFDSMYQSIKSATPYAKDLGDYFGRAAEFASALILVPKEFKEWVTGTASSNNFMTYLFGDVSESEYIESIMRIQTQFSKLALSVEGSFAATRRELQLISSIVTPLMVAIADIVEMFPAISSGDPKKIMAAQNMQLNRKKAKDIVDKEAADGFAMTGLAMTPEQKKLRQMQVYGRLNGEDVSKTETQAYLDNVVELGNKNHTGTRSRLVDMILGWGKDKEEQSLPTPPQTNLNLPQPIINVPQMSFAVPPAEIVVPPANVTVPQASPDQVGSSVNNNTTHTMNIVMSGNVKVDGNVTTEVESVTFSESISNAMAAFFTGQLQQAVPQVAQVPQ